MQNNKYKQGDILVDSREYFRKILGICGDVYHLSSFGRILESDYLKEYNISRTEYQLEEQNFKLYEAPKEVEMTVDEISEALGKTVKVVE